MSDEEPVSIYVGELPKATLLKFGSEGMTMLPAPPGTCEACAVGHEPGQPHNAQSLHYKYWFRLGEVRAEREERWPSWADAMAHCDDETKAVWTQALEERGVDIHAEDA